VWGGGRWRGGGRGGGGWGGGGGAPDVGRRAMAGGTPPGGRCPAPRRSAPADGAVAAPQGRGPPAGRQRWRLGGRDRDRGRPSRSRAQDLLPRRRLGAARSAGAAG